MSETCEDCKKREERLAQNLENDRVLLEGHIADATYKINRFNFEQAWIKKNQNAWRRYIG